MAAVACPSCETVASPGAKFCSECGTALSRSCPSCGTPADTNAKFCAECGTALGRRPAAATAATAAAPVAERRLVTVLFADLVGFTAQSESRDAEEVRELLSRYFETARSVIERYGGRVEKFIGDAVMALWGAPVAQEDDAERGVRAALELVSAVEALGADVRAALERGDDGEARRLLDLIAPDIDATADQQLRAVLSWKRMVLATADGRVDDLLAETDDQARLLDEQGYPTQAARAVGIALDTARVPA